jgi:lambda family phage portal protein
VSKRPLLTAWDRFTMSLAPSWTLNRIRARMVANTLARHYEAASQGRRTSGWNRNRGDANAVIGAALGELRLHSRDLVRNNGWARRAQRVIANNTVGWGIVPKARNGSAKAAELWKRWADSTECDAERRLTFAGLQHLALRSLATDGEVLFRRRPRRPEDALTIPLQLQILEADYLDTSKNEGRIVNGVEYNGIGQRTAYWLFDGHPGSGSSGQSRPIPASEILHVFYTERPSAARGVSWFGAAIVNLKDLDEYEDAELMKQKIAACFAAFVSDVDGTAAPLGEEDPDDDSLEALQPGMIEQLKPGQQVTFGSPPQPTADSFANRNLRKIAATLGVTYEDLTGDYSQVNFSSARMSRIAHWANVYDWQWNMLIPQLCDGVWAWATEAGLPGDGGADWSCPPMPMIEPDKEGLAYQRLVRTGAMTPSEMVRERGGDPEAHWAEYAADLKKLDEYKIKLDSDVRAVSQAGLTQDRVGGGGTAEEAPKEKGRSTDDGGEEIEISDAFLEELLRVDE